METNAEFINEIDTRFTYKAPAGDPWEMYEELRAEGKRFALLVVKCAPTSRERSIAVTKIEEAVMWANAAVARRGEPNANGD